MSDFFKSHHLKKHVKFYVENKKCILIKKTVRYKTEFKLCTKFA